LELDFKGLACGCVDAGNTKMEKPSEIASFAEKVLETLEPKQLYITPNFDLEFIPYTFARQKVRNLGTALDILREED
jgi:methionine synthase II (cobalamin-independent)